MLEFQGKSIETVIEEQGEVVASTGGISMYPMLRNKRDMVVIERINRKLKKHDVPLYRVKSGQLVLHRIIKITDGGYIIRGDNLYVKEKNITDDNIIGVLKAFYRNGKFCDCATSKGYKLYIFWVRISYPVRYVLFNYVRLPLSRCKQFLLRKLRKTENL